MIDGDEVNTTALIERAASSSGAARGSASTANTTYGVTRSGAS
jgi:hypothetical protein